MSYRPWRITRILLCIQIMDKNCAILNCYRHALGWSSVIQSSLQKKTTTTVCAKLVQNKISPVRQSRNYLWSYAKKSFFDHLSPLHIRKTVHEMMLMTSSSLPTNLPDHKKSGRGWEVTAIYETTCTTKLKVPDTWLVIVLKTCRIGSVLS